MEVLSHLYIAFDLGYLSEEQIAGVKEKIFELSNHLNSLRKSQLSRTSKHLNT
jgi:four helix bundle protein